MPQIKEVNSRDCANSGLIMRMIGCLNYEPNGTSIFLTFLKYEVPQNVISIIYWSMRELET